RSGAAVKRAALACALAALFSSSVARAAVSLTKSAVAGDVFPGGQVQYVIVFSRSNFIETGVVIHDQLPPNHTLVKVESISALSCMPPSSGTIGPGLTATCDAGGGDLRIAVGDTVTSANITVTYQVAASVTTSNNTATMTCTTGTCIATSTAMKPICQPAMTLTKSANPMTVQPGGQVTYTLKATNTGTCPLTGYTITDTLQPPLQFVSSDAANAVVNGQTVSVSPSGSLAVNASFNVNIVAQVRPATAPGTQVMNTAGATFPGNGTASSGSVSISVSNAPAALTITKSVAPAHAKIGDPVSYS